MDGSSNKAADNARTMSEIFKGRKVAVFGVPAPFTGTCTFAHVPPFVAKAAEFKSKGVDEIICYSVACPYAHYNWAKAMGVDQNAISFLADVDGDFAREFEVDAEYAEVSLGKRSKRFSMVVEDGTVTSFQIVENAEVQLVANPFIFVLTCP
jgi:peroxiredoxin